MLFGYQGGLMTENWRRQHETQLKDLQSRSQKAVVEYHRAIAEIVDDLPGRTRIFKIDIGDDGLIVEVRIDDFALQKVNAVQASESATDELRSRLAPSMTSSKLPSNRMPDVLELFQQGATAAEVVAALSQQASASSQIFDSVQESDDVIVRLREGSFLDLVIEPGWFETASAEDVEIAIRDRVNAALKTLAAEEDAK